MTSVLWGQTFRSGRLHLWDHTFWSGLLRERLLAGDNPNAAKHRSGPGDNITPRSL
jgi:hypothetical protein